MTATIEYRQGDAPDAWRPVQVERRADGSVQLFVRHPADRCAASVHALRRAIVSAIVLNVVGFWVHWGVGVLVLAVTLLVLASAYARMLATCSAHRWAASREGLLVERVSPRGYRSQRLLPRDRITDAQLNSGRAGGLTLTGYRLGRLGRPQLAGLSDANLQSIAVGVRLGLGLTASPHEGSAPTSV
ncbi:MAG TPA: hypothetical protein VGN72_23770 [Tepidisphaeraceae bacterium]|jgi:hypothetical protein|nr:hypothetical protein [Tepidisphaeraceae bacterium]